MSAVPYLTSGVITCYSWTIDWWLAGCIRLSGRSCCKLLEAVQEVFDKHKGASPAVYGDLGYLIFFATAADAVTIFAFDLKKGGASDTRVHGASCNHYQICVIYFNAVCSA